MDDKKREEIKAIVRGEISRALVESRESAKLTIESAATLFGCDVDVLLKYESGEIQPLIFVRLLRLYGIPQLVAYERLTEISLKIAAIRS